MPPANRHAGYTPATELKGLGYMARQMFEAEISAKEMHSIRVQSERVGGSRGAGGKF